MQIGGPPRQLCCHSPLKKGGELKCVKTSPLLSLPMDKGETAKFRFSGMAEGLKTKRDITMTPAMVPAI